MLWNESQDIQTKVPLCVASKIFNPNPIWAGLIPDKADNLLLDYCIKSKLPHFPVSVN